MPNDSAVNRPLFKAFIQARMGSSRLPGKILMPIQKKSILLHIVEQLRKSFGQEDIVVLTTSNPIDQLVIKFCESNKISYFVGDENNVYDRFASASKVFPALGYFRFTADNPFIDLGLLESIRSRVSCQPVSKKLFISTKNRGLPIGMDIEFFSRDLVETPSNILTDYDLEHVTPWMYRYLNLENDFVPKQFVSQKSRPRISLTVDTEEDLARARDFSAWLNGRSPSIRLSWEWADEP